MKGSKIFPYAQGRNPAFFRQVADKKMPFALKVPNTETRAAMVEADEMTGVRRARFDSAIKLFKNLEKTAQSQQRVSLPK